MKSILVFLYTVCLGVALSAQSSLPISDTIHLTHPTEIKHFTLKEFEGVQATSMDDIYFASRDVLEEKYKDFKPQIEPDYFLLGTLVNYLDRAYGSKEYKEDDYFNSYSDNDTSKILYLINLSTDSLNVDIVLKLCNNTVLLYSKALTQRMESYFVAPKKLKQDLFQTDKQRYSYLLGMYFRNGRYLGDHSYEIELNNFLENQRFFQLLIDLDCKDFTYKKIVAIPGKTIVTFEAPVLVEKYFIGIKNVK